MTVGSILLATALLFLVGVYVFRPILTPSRYIPPATLKEKMLARKDALLINIRALDFDFETGKLAEATYQRERYNLVQQAADILYELDRLPEETNSVDDQIEAAIAALRGISPAVKTVAVTCSKCSHSISERDKFCRNCGEKLA